MDRLLPKITKIPITVQIIGNPLPVLNKIFDVKKNSKDSKFTISRTIMIQKNIECSLNEYVYRNQPGAPQDILLVFEVSENTSNSSKISEFLYSKLRDFKKTLIIFNEHESQIEKTKIKELLEKYPEDYS